jgi:hypothetical protein
VQDPSSKATSPIEFFYRRSGLARHSAPGLAAVAWTVCLLIAMVHLSGCGVTYNTLPLAVSPGSLSFGSVPVGQTQGATVTLQNQGLSDVSLTGVQIADPAFTLSPAAMPATIPAGGTASIIVTFAPTEAKDYSSQIVLQSKGGDTKLGVSGAGQHTGQPPPPSGTPALQLSTTALQFGSVPIGGDAQQSLTLTSSGTAPLHINALNATDADFVAQAPLLPLTLQPGQTLSLPVKFGPLGAGVKTGQLVIGSDATATPSVAVSLTGNGAAPTPPPNPPTPALTLSDTAIDFGSVTMGSQASASVTLTSSGTAAVVLQAMTVSGDAFSAGQLQLPLTLAPGQQVALPLTFAPTASGSQQGQITFADNATGSPSAISLTGTGVTPPTVASLSAPSSVEFGDVTVGAQGSKTITLVSDGTAPVTVTSIKVAGADFSGSAMALPQVLKPNQQMSLNLKFNPGQDGDANGTVTVSSTSANTSTKVVASKSANNSTQVVKVHGKGVGGSAPALSASASSLNFGQVLVNSKASKTVTVTSTGTAPATITAGSVTGGGYTATYAGVPVGSLSAPITLQPGQQVAFSVNFDPTATGTTTGQLSLATDTGSPVNVALSGQGMQSTSPALTLSAPSLNFGDVQMGANAVLQLTLTSSGTAPVTISSATITGQQFQVTSVAYPSGVSGWPATLNPGQQVVLSITFAPDAVNSFSGDLALASDASGGTANVPLSGNGVAVPAPSLTLSTTSINFGPAQIGTKVTRSVTLTSSGNAPLDINTITIAGAPFSVGTLSLPATLQPGQQLTVNVTYEPTTVEADAGTLTVASNDPSGPATVSLGGNGTAAPTPQLTVTPTAVNFGSTPVNVPVTQPVTLTSTGTAAVTISAATVSGAGFSVSGATFPVTLNPNQALTLQVRFDPTAAGSATGQLNISSDSTTGGTAQVTLAGNGTVTTTPQLTVSATALNFGNVTVGSSATLPLTLTSSGTAPVTINAATLSGASFVDSGATFPVTLNPNQSVTLQVQFDPTAAGAVTGQLAITSNSTTGGTVVVQLSGTGTVATTPQLTVSANTIPFGNVTVGSTATLPLTLTSSGTAPVTINAATLSGASFVDSGATFPVTLNPNQSVTLQVQFDPTAAGSATGQLTITSNSTTGGTVVVQLSGTGTVATTPQLTVSATALNFGNVTVGSSATLPLTLTSSGTAPVTINAATLTGASFADSGANFPVTLNPNQSVTLQVQFNPTAAGAVTGQLTITSNSTTGGTANVTLSGTGTVPTTPQLTVSANTMPFGNVTVGSTATLPLTLTSSGTAPVTINAATLSGASFVDSGATFPVTLNPNQSVTLQVQFDPTAAGAVTGQLTITSNSTTGGTVVVQLSGTGTTPKLMVSANSLSFGNVAVSSTATLPLTLTSSGTAPLTINAAALSGASFGDSGATFPVTLNPNQSVTLQVQFDPTAAGAATGQLTITSNSTTGGTVVVQLSGTGTTTPQLLVSATSLPFGSVPVGSTGTQSLTLTSSGTAPVTINSVALQGTGFSDSGATFPVTLNPNQSVTLQVQFDPTAAGAVSGTLTITSNSTTGSPTLVTLSGTGTAVPHEIDLSWDAPATSTDPVAGYNVYRSTDGGASFTRLNASPDSQVTYIDSSVQSGSTYVYEVKSVDASGVESGASNEITLTVP